MASGQSPRLKEARKVTLFNVMPSVFYIALVFLICFNLFMGRAIKKAGMLT